MRNKKNPLARIGWGSFYSDGSFMATDDSMKGEGDIRVHVAAVHLYDVVLKTQPDPPPKRRKAARRVSRK